MISRGDRREFLVARAYVTGYSYDIYDTRCSGGRQTTRFSLDLVFIAIVIVVVIIVKQRIVYLAY